MADHDPSRGFEVIRDYPAVQIRLELIGRDELRERLEDTRLIQAPKRLAAEYAADS